MAISGGSTHSITEIMLRAKRSTIITHLPATRGSDFPLPEGTITLPHRLAVDGSEDNPDEFDLRERIPTAFAGDSPQQAGQRVNRLEEILAEYPGIEQFEDDTQTSGTDGETDTTPE